MGHGGTISRFYKRYWQQLSEVVEHLFDVGAVVEEWARLLPVGGLLALTTPYHGLVKNMLIVLTNFERHFAVSGAHLRFFTPRALERLVNSRGFRLLWLRYYGRCWPVPSGMFALFERVSPN